MRSRDRRSGGIALSPLPFSRLRGARAPVGGRPPPLNLLPWGARAYGTACRGALRKRGAALTCGQVGRRAARSSGVAVALLVRSVEMRRYLEASDWGTAGSRGSHQGVHFLTWQVGGEFRVCSTLVWCASERHSLPAESAASHRANITGERLSSMLVSSLARIICAGVARVREA